MKQFELVPRNGRKSFGGKAIVEERENKATLLSYNTPVAHYDKRTRKMEIPKYHSATTGTHINAFLEHYGFPPCTKKELAEKYGTAVK